MATECIVAGELGLELDWDGGQLAAMRLGWSKDMHATEKPSAKGRELARALDRYARGEAVEWPDVPLALDGLTPFTRNVLMALRDNAPHGVTLSYGELAALAGRPGAARAVGGVMRRNPWPLVIPCHRVIGADGSLVGFMGRSRDDGLALKAFLLQLEGAR